MPVTHPTQRVGVLADAQNLYHTAQSLYSRNIDYSSLLEGALEGREPTRAIAYVIRANSPRRRASSSRRSSTSASRRASRTSRRSRTARKGRLGRRNEPRRRLAGAPRRHYHPSVRATATLLASVATSRHEGLSRRGDELRRIHLRGTRRGGRQLREPEREPGDVPAARHSAKRRVERSDRLDWTGVFGRADEQRAGGESERGDRSEDRRGPHPGCRPVPMMMRAELVRSRRTPIATFRVSVAITGEPQSVIRYKFLQNRRNDVICREF